MSERIEIQSAHSLPQLTLRAAVTGIIIGAILTPCNIYSGLKIGWSFNMSITAALLSFAFWQLRASYSKKVPHWGIGENTINQTTASSAASIISGGLVAPIPAYTLITGNSLSAPALMLWVFAVSILGVLVAFALREQLLIREKAVFPAGVATAETLQNIYGKSNEAMQRVAALGIAGVIGVAVKLWDSFMKSVFALPRLQSTSVVASGGALASGGTKATATNLTFGFEPSMLLLGFGAIIGIKSGISLLLGAILAWGILAPIGLTGGWITPGTNDSLSSWFGELLEFLLWPGVSLMVASSLTSFITCLLKKKTDEEQAEAIEEVLPAYKPVWKQRWFYCALLASTTLLVILQVSLFDIDWWIAILAVPVAFILGIVASRVVADTGIPPIGALGKVSQVTFAGLAPGSVVANLMTANVAGGTAGQSADLFNDLKTGLLVGVSPKAQAVAQVCGIITGSIVGSMVYLVLIPDPKNMLLTEEWAAPAVATWKVVAETLGEGLGSISFAARVAIVVGCVIGVGFELFRSYTPPKWDRYFPSMAALGLAFVIPASLSITMFTGALLAWLAGKYIKNLATRFTLAIAAGLVAGESLAGVFEAIINFSG